MRNQKKQILIRKGFEGKKSQVHCHDLEKLSRPSKRPAKTPKFLNLLFTPAKADVF